MKRVYGFDLDGVISKTNSIFFSYYVWMIVEKLGLSKLSFFQRFYDKYFRKPNKEIIKVIWYLVGIGKRIVIISCTRESWRENLEKWLKENNIPYDQLILRPEIFEVDLDSLACWKAEMVEKNRCDAFIDDFLFFAERISILADIDINVLHYQNQKAEEVIAYFEK